MRHAFAETLLSLLLVRMFESTSPSYSRCAAASYIASFLARAQFVPISTVAHCLRLCAEWIHGYLDRVRSRIAGLSESGDSNRMGS
jgi:RNA polymerase I-specific transcription initiation factor RRN3